MKSWHKSVAVGVAAAALVIAGAISTHRAAQASPERIFQRVSGRLSCQCGCNQPLSGCNHHPCDSADPMRAQIRAAIAQGKDEEAIVQDFVRQMGVVVLAAPPAQGFTLAAWIMPAVALLLGLVVIYRVVRKWRSGDTPPGLCGDRPPGLSRQAGDPSQEALLQRYASSIDEELEREP